MKLKLEKQQVASMEQNKGAEISKNFFKKDYYKTMALQTLSSSAQAPVIRYHKWSDLSTTEFYVYQF